MSINDKLRSAMNTGEELVLDIRVRARVVSTHDSHGACFMLKLEQRDYLREDSRVVFLDDNEILSVTK